MIDGLLESIFGSIANAIAEARKQQGALAAEQDAARAKFMAAREKFEAQKAAGAQVPPARVAIRRKQAPPAAVPAPGPPPARPAPGGLTLFQSADDLVRAFVMAEVLAKPVALREPSTNSPGPTL